MIEQHRRADAEPEADAGLTEGHDGIDGEDDVEDEPEVEEVAVDVLQEQGETGLTAVGAVAVGDGAGRGRQPEGPVIGLAVVVAGEAEAEGEDQDQQRRRDGPPGDDGAGVAAGYATGSEARRVEGGDQVTVLGRPDVVVLVHEGRPRGVGHEGGEHGHGDHGLDPVAVASERRDVRASPAPTQYDGGYRGLLQGGQFVSPSCGCPAASAADPGPWAGDGTSSFHPDDPVAKTVVPRYLGPPVPPGPARRICRHQGRGLDAPESPGRRRTSAVSCRVGSRP